jgi:hypothetical protein
VRGSGQKARPDPRFASALARATRTGSWCAGPGKARRARYSDGPCCSARRPRRAALARRAAHCAHSGCLGSGGKAQAKPPACPGTPAVVT